ncbi:MAG: hypothetical protein QOF14_917 [Hyphomicrobiales bacterium]|jgi:hypothetical protein|nr:hypothetical protein [Hyphomicrobiales bacterium]
MPVYTVHEPPRRDDELLAHTARFQFVRDGFHFWAFLLSPLWMLRHRLWLEFIVYLLLVGGITFALRRLGVAESAGGAVAFLLVILIGIEASSLRRWKLSRRGYDNLGVVVADDQDIAERRFFDGWISDTGRLATPSPFAPPPAAPSPFDRPAPSSEIVGLFPQPQARS